MIRSVRSPGFFDLQVNGFGGVDFNDPRTTEADLLRAIRTLRSTGVTRFLPALITSTPERFAACARTIAACDHPAVAGIHMEGPYLAEAARGVHPREALRPAALDDFERRQEAAGGRIALVTLAPEVPGALALIEALRARGVTVAIGHTGAEPPLVREAVAAGATLSTHLGNGGPREVPRHPNFIWEQLAADELAAGFIADGHHLAPSVIKAMARAKGAARTRLVTDATAAAGQPPGRYRIGDVEAELDASGRVVDPVSRRLAGSALRMDVAVGNMIRFTGFALDEVLPMASALPAGDVGAAPAGVVEATWDAGRAVLTIVQVTGGE